MPSKTYRVTYKIHSGI